MRRNPSYKDLIAEYSWQTDEQAQGTTTMENSMRLFKKLRIQLPYNLAVPLLSIYPEKTIIRKHTCNPNVHCSTIHNSQDMKAP